MCTTQTPTVYTYTASHVCVAKINYLYSACNYFPFCSTDINMLPDIVVDCVIGNRISLRMSCYLVESISIYYVTEVDLQETPSHI